MTKAEELHRDGVCYVVRIDGTWDLAKIKVLQLKSKQFRAVVESPGRAPRVYRRLSPIRTKLEHAMKRLIE